MADNKYINNFVINYYGYMPIIAFIISVFRNVNDEYSYIITLNLLVSFLAFSYFFSLKRFRLLKYETYFLIYAISAVFLDALRGQFWSYGNKPIIESLFVVLSSTVFVLTPPLRKKLTKLFIFYIITSFVVVIIQRVLGIIWYEIFQISDFSPDEVARLRFGGFWYAIDVLSNITVLSFITAIVCMELLSNNRSKLAIVILSMSIVTSVLSNSRASMLYMVLVLLAFILYKNNSILKSTTKSISLAVVFLSISFILNKYEISLSTIWKERIYQSDKPFEERSESARVNNMEFFFSGKYLKLLGNGFEFSKEYQKDSGRNHPGLLIGMLNPMFGYGIFSIFYYLFLFSLIKKAYKYYKLTKNGFFLAIFVGFVLVGFTAGFTYLSHMHGFFLLLFFKTYFNNVAVDNSSNTITTKRLSIAKVDM